MVEKMGVEWHWCRGQAGPCCTYLHPCWHTRCCWQPCPCCCTLPTPAPHSSSRLPWWSWQVAAGQRAVGCRLLLLVDHRAAVVAWCSSAAARWSAASQPLPADHSACLSPENTLTWHSKSNQAKQVSRSIPQPRCHHLRRQGVAQHSCYLWAKYIFG